MSYCTYGLLSTSSVTHTAPVYDHELPHPILQGEDLGPLELKIDTLQKQITDSVEQCTGMQQFWLRQQNELVRKTREGEEEATAMDSLKKQQLILEQKKLRIDGRGTLMMSNKGR